MAESNKQRLVLRLLTLGVLTLCLAVLSRNGSNAPLASTKEPPSVSTQTQAPPVVVQAQPDTPLFLSSVSIISSD